MACPRLAAWRRKRQLMPGVSQLLNSELICLYFSNSRRGTLGMLKFTLIGFALILKGLK